MRHTQPRTFATLSDLAPILATLLPPKPQPAQKKHYNPHQQIKQHWHMCNGDEHNTPHRWVINTTIPNCPHKENTICPVNVQCPEHVVGNSRQ